MVHEDAASRSAGTTGLTGVSISVGEVFAQYQDGTFGIPHFQRGLVWSQDNVAQLLESLFLGTPCGTIILWVPERPSHHGVRLNPVARRIPTHLVLDGQQRIRAICDVLQDLTQKSPRPSTTERDQEQEYEENLEDGGDGYEWCVNPAHVPQLRPFLEEDSALMTKPFFLMVKHPRAAKTGRHLGAVLPLRDLWSESLAWCVECLGGDSGQPNNGLVAGLKKLAADVRRIEARNFFLIVQYETRDSASLGNVVQLYNRINSGGLRVLTEERAYAMLVSTVPSTERTVRELFEEIHPCETGESTLQRDDLLTRRREQGFGFKLFVRGFLQGLCHELDYRPNDRNLSFTLLEKGNVANALRDQKLGLLWRKTKLALSFVHARLTQDLCCDDLRFCPDAISLLPAMELLFQFPSICEDSRERHGAVVSWLLLTTYLRDLPSKDLYALAHDVRIAQSWKDLMALIQQQETACKKELKPALRDAQSMQNRYALMLYWLTRHHGASDFSYRNLEHSELKPGKEPVLSRECRPEKQHLVPYALLKLLFKELNDGPGRVSFHEANDIGNLTYISSDLNGLTGLCSQQVDLKYETEDNRKAHCLDRMVRKFADAGRGKLKYREFCKHRRNLIQDAFVAWMDELRKEALAAPPLEPSP